MLASHFSSNMDNSDISWYLPADPSAKIALVNYRRDHSVPLSEGQWFNIANPLLPLPGEAPHSLEVNKRILEAGLRRSLQPQPQPTGLGIDQNQRASQIPRTHQVPPQAQRSHFAGAEYSNTSVNRGATPSPNPNAYTFSDPRHQNQQRSPAPPTSTAADHAPTSAPHGYSQSQYSHQQAIPPRSQTSTPVNGNGITTQHNVYANSALPYQQPSPQQANFANAANRGATPSPSAYTSPHSQQPSAMSGIMSTSSPSNFNPPPAYTSHTAVNGMPYITQSQGPPPTRLAQELRALQRPSAPSTNRHDSVSPNMVFAANGHMARSPVPASNGFASAPRPGQAGRSYLTPQEIQHFKRMEMPRKEVQQQVFRGAQGSRPQTPYQGVQGARMSVSPQSTQGNWTQTPQESASGSRTPMPQQGLPISRTPTPQPGMQDNRTSVSPQDLQGNRAPTPQQSFQGSRLSVSPRVIQDNRTQMPQQSMPDNRMLNPEQRIPSSMPPLPQQGSQYGAQNGMKLSKGCER